VSIIDTIDKALADYAVSDDAMRWTPEPAPEGSGGCGCTWCQLVAQFVVRGDLYFRLMDGPPVGISPVHWSQLTVRGAALNRVVLDEATALVPQSEDEPVDLRGRALWLRRNRNTGPAVTVGLDGRRRR
jgi:hypothetical protein